MKNKHKIKSLEALYKIIEIVPNNSKILDIGAGKLNVHANIFREAGFTVDTVDFFEESTYIGDFNQIQIKEKYDVIWASHCLEHQLNVNSFLKKIHNTLKPNGYVAITVPPLKHEIVGGHVNLWNGGLLIYNLILAGFDCSNIMIKKYDYNISGIVRKTNSKIPEASLVYDSPDLITLKDFFPKKLSYRKNNIFDGDIESLNWT